MWFSVYTVPLMEQLSGLDLNEVAVFVEVVRAGSFTEAGQALGLPKSTVSRRVSRLEASLGVRLLQRTTRKLSLTDAGAAFHTRAAAAMAAVEEARTVVTQMHTQPRGLLRVTAPVDISPQLAAIVHAYVQAHPEVTVEVLLTSRRVDLVGEGIDVALRGGVMRDSALIARKLLGETTRLYASPEYIRAHGQPRTPQELAQHACVVLMGDIQGTKWRLTGPEGEVAVTVKPRQLANDYSFVRAATLAGSGVALMPSLICLEAERAGQLVRVMPRYESRRAGFYLVYPSATYVPAKVRAFNELAMAWFKRFSESS